jgi:c-di-AMP phosphodiesterase-like protein
LVQAYILAALRHPLLALPVVLLLPTIVSIVLNVLLAIVAVLCVFACVAVVYVVASLCETDVESVSEDRNASTTEDVEIKMVHVPAEVLQLTSLTSNKLYRQPRCCKRQ